MSKGIGDMYGFCARVTFAHRFILSGSHPTRKFETCFEMWDGEIVAAALWRKANRDEQAGYPLLMSRIQDYLSFDAVKQSAEKYTDSPDWKLREKSFDMVESNMRESLKKLQAMDAKDGTDNTLYIKEERLAFLNRPQPMKSWKI